ncbi:MAG: hypothetical protein ABL874_06500 [Sphingopyxis sp.]
MDALMICLLACGAASLGSRWWLVASTVRFRLPNVSAHFAIIATAALGSAVAAWFGASIAAQFRGPGMLLLLALALLFAGAGMAWPARPLPAKSQASVKGPLSALILLAAAMLSDSAPFIIFAAAARTGSAAFAAIGGTVGLAAAAMLVPAINPAETLPPWLHWLRRTIALLLFVVGVIAAINALGLL